MIEDACTRIFTETKNEQATPPTFPHPIPNTYEHLFSSTDIHEDDYPTLSITANKKYFASIIAGETSFSLNDRYESILCSWEEHAVTASLIAEELLVRHVLTVAPFDDVAAIVLAETFQNNEPAGTVSRLVNTAGDVLVDALSPQWELLPDVGKTETFASELYDLIPTLFTYNEDTNVREYVVHVDRENRTPR